MPDSRNTFRHLHTFLRVHNIPEKSEQKLECPFLGILALVGARQQQQENRTWNRLYMDAVGSGRMRTCSLCCKIVHGGWLECDNHGERKSPKANTWLRWVGLHGRFGGHITCVACLKKRQGIDWVELTRGTVKVCKYAESRDVVCILVFFVPLPVSYRLGASLLFFFLLHGGVHKNASRSSISW